VVWPRFPPLIGRYRKRAICSPKGCKAIAKFSGRDLCWRLRNGSFGCEQLWPASKKLRGIVDKPDLRSSTISILGIFFWNRIRWSQYRLRTNRVRVRESHFFTSRDFNRRRDKPLRS
jgi:hypothetical protein